MRVMSKAIVIHIGVANGECRLATDCDRNVRSRALCHAAAAVDSSRRRGLVFSVCILGRIIVIFVAKC